MRDRAVGDQNPIALTLPDHELDFVYQELARLSVVIDLACALKVVECDLNCAFQQKRGCVIFEPGRHGANPTPFSFIREQRQVAAVPKKFGAPGSEVAGTNVERMCCIRTRLARRDTKMAMIKELDKSEFGNLIGSDKVEGTAVFGVNDRKIGTIERVMIDKISGKVSYAVLGFGGFLGVGSDHYPMPWQSSKFDTDLGGY